MPRKRTSPGFPSQRHDHRRCIADALAAAERLCTRRGARLTATRRKVLELVWEGHRPMLAYDLLSRLQRDQPRAAPPTVYRALDFLQAHGLVHRLESLNAYVGCADPGHPHAGQFLICSDCEQVAELDDHGIGELIADRARVAGFVSESQTVEIRGRCAACQRQDGS